MQLPDYYKTLGVSPSASAEEINRAYVARLRALEHEKIGPTLKERRQNAVIDAYAVLKNPELRAAYDRQYRKLARASDGFLGWLRKLFSGKKKSGKARGPEERPTLTQLMDFDWDSLEEDPKETPGQKKAFYDEILFKILVVAVVLILVVLVFAVT